MKGQECGIHGDGVNGDIWSWDRKDAGVLIEGNGLSGNIQEFVIKETQPPRL